jgi:hypothetical protein
MRDFYHLIQAPTTPPLNISIIFDDAQFGRYQKIIQLFINMEVLKILQIKNLRSFSELKIIANEIEVASPLEYFQHKTFLEHQFNVAEFALRSVIDVSIISISNLEQGFPVYNALKKRCLTIQSLKEDILRVFVDSEQFRSPFPLQVVVNFCDLHSKRKEEPRERKSDDNKPDIKYSSDLTLIRPIIKQKTGPTEINPPTP